MCVGACACGINKCHQVDSIAGEETKWWWMGEGKIRLISENMRD